MLKLKNNTVLEWMSEWDLFKHFPLDGWTKWSVTDLWPPKNTGMNCGRLMWYRKKNHKRIGTASKLQPEKFQTGSLMAGWNEVQHGKSRIKRLDSRIEARDACLQKEGAQTEKYSLIWKWQRSVKLIYSLKCLSGFVRMASKDTKLIVAVPFRCRTNMKI